MTDFVRQTMTETFQAVESYHVARRTELQAEIARLRTNLLAVGAYAESQAEKYEAAGEEGSYMAEYFRGKAEAYEDMARRIGNAYVMEGD